MPNAASSRRTNSACSLSYSALVLTASAASLSDFSEPTLASISGEKNRIGAPQFRIGYECTRVVPLLQRSVPSFLERLEPTAPHPVLLDYASRRLVDSVANGLDLEIDCISFRGCFSSPRPTRSLSLAFFWPNHPVRGI